MRLEKPFRLTIAQLLCRYLPPLISQRVRDILYPRQLAYQDNTYVEVQAQTGSFYCGNIADYHIYPFSVHGYYYWRAWAIALAVCSVGDTIIEIGANVGTETIGFSDIVGRVGKVIAFEPSPGNIRILSTALESTRCNNISIYPFAVGDVNASVWFSASKTLHDSGVGYVVSGQEQQDGLFKVRSVTLDSFLDPLISPHLIHVDVEGSEVKVLRGSRDTIIKHKPVLVLEASPKLLKRANFTLQDLLSEISGLDYVPFGISKLNLIQIDAKIERGLSNWVCLHKTRLSLVPIINKSIKKSGLYPCVPGINPMSQK